MDKNKFGTFIKQKRMEQGYTQKELAELLMVDVTTVSKWERGVNYPDITMIPDICKNLKVNEHELIESSTDTQYREITAQAKKYRRIKDSIFYSFSAGYVIAVIVCFFIIAVYERNFSRFGVSLAGCLCGFTFVPSCLRFLKKYQLSAYLFSTWLSMTILFIACSIYTHDYWFAIASSGVLLGYFTVFFPVLFSKQKKYMAEERYIKLKKFFLLIYTSGDFLLSLFVLISVNIYNSSYSFNKGFIALIIGFILPALWSIAEFIPIKRLTKTGIDFIATGIYLYALNGVLNYLFGDNGVDSYHIDFSNWDNFFTGNLLIMMLVLFLVSGITMMSISAYITHRKR